MGIPCIDLWDIMFTVSSECVYSFWAKTASHALHTYLYMHGASVNMECVCNVNNMKALHEYANFMEHMKQKKKNNKFSTTFS